MDAYRWPAIGGDSRATDACRPAIYANTPAPGPDTSRACPPVYIPVRGFAPNPTAAACLPPYEPAPLQATAAAIPLPAAADVRMQQACEPPSAVPRSTGIPTWVWWAVGAAVVAAALGFAWYQWYRRRKTEAEMETEMAATPPAMVAVLGSASAGPVATGTAAAPPPSSDGYAATGAFVPPAPPSDVAGNAPPSDVARAGEIASAQQRTPVPGGTDPLAAAPRMPATGNGGGEGGGGGMQPGWQTQERARQPAADTSATDPRRVWVAAAQHPGNDVLGTARCGSGPPDAALPGHPSAFAFATVPPQAAPGSARPWYPGGVAAPPPIVPGDAGLPGQIAGQHYAPQTDASPSATRSGRRDARNEWVPLAEMSNYSYR